MLDFKPMQRWLSGLRRTIGNRVTANPVRRFKSSSLRQKICQNFLNSGRFFYHRNPEEDLWVGGVLRKQNGLRRSTLWRNKV